MRIYGQLKDCLVMTKKEQPGKKDPSKKYCYVGVVMNDELGEISVTSDVFGALEIGHYYDFGFCYNTNYEMFQLEQCQHVGMSGFAVDRKQQLPEHAAVEVPAPEPEKAAKSEKAGK